MKTNALGLLSNRRLRFLVLLCIDLACMLLSSFLILGVYPSTAYRLDNDTRILHATLVILFLFVSRFAFRVYAQSWRYASDSVYLKMVISDWVGGALYLAVNYIFVTYKITFIHAMTLVAMELVFTLTSRFCYHVYRTQGSKRERDGEAPQSANIAVVGASEMGVLLVKELLINKATDYVPVCFFDNNPLKIGNYILGLKVYPENDGVEDIARKLAIDTFVIAIPNKDPQYYQQLYEQYRKTGRKVMIYDFPINQIADEQGKRNIREINIEDLLPRAAVDLEDSGKNAFYRGKRVMVTGAGGSIGGELVRQLAVLEPEILVLLDIYENGVYDIQQELKFAFKDKLKVSVEIASILDEKKMDEIFTRYKPDYVFHAAAHKHVPLMENNPDEAIKNNVFGTFNVVNAAEKAGVKRFVMISTDKAVNPTNIMGATKRLCEMIIQSRKDSQTDFVAVRFGNVLNSNGSVIPLFKRQIAQRGPITVTDKRIVRYFMLIPEAAQLVLQTGCLAEKGDLYVLDMGKPVKILELAENMIRLSGLEPYVDIQIEEVGLRPGEKLYEELLTKGENTQKTKNQHIYIERGESFTREEILIKLDTLKIAVESGKAAQIKEAVKRTVPSYCDAGEVNSRAEASREMRQSDS